jgi:GNAT superfamily N-acetyltransferase
MSEHVRIFHELRGLDDPHTPAFMDIYQASFPLSEQMRFSWWIGMLLAKAAGQEEVGHPLALLEDGEVAAISYYESGAPETAAYLWYLATREDLRGRGVGAELYRGIVERTRNEGSPALLFEVETIEQARSISEEAAIFARRRIEFYRRMGAHQLGGIHYVQNVGWQPPIEMHIMVHPFIDISAETIFALTTSHLGTSIQQTGPLSLN